jgi:hypothetical protein
MSVVALGILVLVGLAVGELIWGDGDLLGVDSACSTAGTSCGLLQSMVLSLFPISVAVVWVFLVRLDRVRSKYRKYAWEHPAELLETKIPSPHIVGRDDLCKILQKDLESRWEVEGLPGRRPIVLVGGVGIGKTAVLARLTQLLAERGAVPVPIRLRAVQDGKLDLLDLARRKFLDTAPVLSNAEADKIWRRLWSNDQIVIVADGLEEALMGVEDTRETSLRVALNDVRRHDVALIVSSRPHEALVHLDAATVMLEPLEPQAALAYITAGGDASDDEIERARRIVMCAEVAEMPLFMHYARELREAGALDSSLDIRDVGRLGLRVRLLERWMEVLQEGKIEPAVPVEPRRRREVIAELEKFAALGLTRDSLEVTFDDIKDAAKGRPNRSAVGSKRTAHTPNGSHHHDAIDATTEGLRAVAADADRLGLVDALRDGVRFRHSVMQAYLGSRAITAVLNRSGQATPDRETLAEGLEDGLKKPGRELLMALAMSCTLCDEHARTRAIRLLLRNVEREGPKAVGTASAVIAAASASTERSRSAGRRDEDPADPRFSTRSDFRQEVVRWLKRAEREDAERAAEEATRRADEAANSTEEAVDEVRNAVLEANRKRTDLEAVEQGSGDGDAGHSRTSVYTNRIRQATRANNEAQAAVAAARRQADISRSDQAAALAELCVAKTMLAEKRLTEADVETTTGLKEQLQERAVASLREAIDAYSEAAVLRKGAADLQDEIAALPEPATGSLDAGALAELLLARIAHADAQLTEAAAPWTRSGTASALRGAARWGVDNVIETALGFPLLRRAAGIGPPPARATDPDARKVAELMRTAAHKSQDLVGDAVTATDGTTTGRLLVEAARALGDTSDPDDAIDRANPKLGTGEAALATVATFNLASRALAGAADASACLERASDTDDARTRQDMLDEAAKALGDVSSTAEAAAAAEVTAVGHRARALAALPLAAKAGVKAELAIDRLTDRSTDEKPERLMADVVASLTEVSDESDRAKADEPFLGSARPSPPRATSRTQVLVPLRRTTREHETPADDGVFAAKLDAIARLSDAAQFAWLWDVCRKEDDYLVRLSAARKLGDGGQVAFDLIHDHLWAIHAAAGADTDGPRRRDDAARTIEGIDGLAPERAFELQGWLLPLLFCSIERDQQRERDAKSSDGDDQDVGSRTGIEPHRDLLQRWVRRVCDGVSVTSDMALAQGFRLAANRRDLSPGQAGFLAARAREQVRKTNFWFSRIAVVQALTLWTLSDAESQRRSGPARSADREAEDNIYSWCDPAGHPLVTEAIELCATAFRRRQPENYLWLDEGLATAKLGAGPVAARMGGTDAQWIPASAGWLSLAPRAARLLGELVVFLNLALRGDDLEAREQHLQRTTPKEADEPQRLPTCLASRDERYRLDVGRRLDDRVEPGARCATATCDMSLCPYPGLGEDLARGELSEAFCRRQHQHVHGELKRFWRQMEERPRA